MYCQCKIVYLDNVCLNIFCPKMLTIGKQIRKLRKNRGLPLRKIAAMLDIDQSILSKIERGQRRATKEQVIKIAKIFNVEEKQLLINYLSDKVLFEIMDEDLAEDALKVAEQKIKYANETRIQNK